MLCNRERKKRALRYQVLVALILSTTAGWVLFLCGFGILISCCRDLRSIFSISHWFVILLLPAYVITATVNVIKNHYWLLEIINIIISAIYILSCGNSMCLFWGSVALSDGTCSKQLVGNALGLTGILLSAMLVVPILMMSPISNKLDRSPVGGVDNATFVEMKKNEVYGLNVQQSSEQQPRTAVYEGVPSH